MAPTEFNTLALRADMLSNLTSMGYQTMTPIQAASLPAVLDGQDVIAQAKTGSGKTAAFGIGLLTKIDAQKFSVQALVICPTRELADQVGKEIRRLARFTPNIKLLTLCGGAPIGPQFGSLEHGAHIIVGTPGRIKKHLDKATLKLEHVTTLVLDEADRMLDMGFYDDIAAIVAQVPSRRQTLLFSATYPASIKALSARFQKNAVDVKVEATHDDAHIEQVFYETSAPQKSTLLTALLAHYHPESTVVFCNTKVQCQNVADNLVSAGFSAQALHGDMEQKDRDRVLILFSNKSNPILVATDVAARGLDVKDLQAVISFDLAFEAETHIHRIGRTGRAGKAGLALSLVTPADAQRMIAIEEYQQAPLVFGNTSALLENRSAEKPQPMVTLCINGGRKSKVRPGDILGALTGEAGIAGEHVGKIDIFDNHAYVAIAQSVAQKALKYLAEGKIKGRKFKVRKL
ncbi:MAG: ATP-dependent RNA helicase DbpA [Sulfuricaulis sp.]|nr:ATP-dependent RNA helicase DbpA [Sulfuricaulis sp.]